MPTTKGRKITNEIGDALVKAREVEVYGDSEVGAILQHILILHHSLVERVEVERDLRCELERRVRELEAGIPAEVAL